MSTLTPSDFKELWIPQRPSVSNNFKTEKSYKVPRSEAFDKVYVQTNPVKARNLITIDLDVEDSDWFIKGLLEDEKIPTPSYWTINPSTKSHVGYFIDGFAHSPKALHAFQSAQNTLRDLMGGDKAYGAYMTRNPLNAYQRTAWGTDHLYTLKEIEEIDRTAFPEKWVETAQENKRKSSTVMEKRVEDAPEGFRNVTLFAELRVFAYRCFNRHEDSEGFREEVFAEGFKITNSWSSPLDDDEVFGICERICKWVESNFSAEKFKAIQTARSHRRAVVQNKAFKYESVNLFVECGFSIREIAEFFDTTYESAKKLVQRARSWAGSGALT